MLPFVSILIPTYARVSWLEESLYCALHQDYGGRLEILVGNDCGRQTLVCDNPLVRIFNAQPHMTLGAKRNGMLRAASGEYFVWLDDDDLALPWYVNRLVLPLKHPGARAVVSQRCYHIAGNAWRPSAVSIEVACSPRHALSVGGYPNELDSGEDQIFRCRLEAAGNVTTIVSEPGGYVYRWGQGVYHISGQGGDLDGDAFRRDAEWRMDNGREPSGLVKLKPRLRRDYFAGAPGEVRRQLPAGIHPPVYKAWTPPHKRAKKLR